MVTFWIIAALLIVVALAFVLIPLLRSGHSRDEVISRDAANIDILRNQLSELDADLTSGVLQQEHYELARNELQKRVLDEVSSAKPLLRSADRGSNRKSAIVLGLAIPVLAVGLYYLLGNPLALTVNADQRSAQDMTREQVEDMVNRLAQRMQTNPDPKGWALLARSYASMGQFRDSAAAYGKLSEMVPQDADVLIEWADTLAMAQGRNLDGEPEKLIRRAIALNPDHPKGLALLGSIDYLHKDYESALKNWRHMMTLVQPDSELAQAISSGIEKAESLSGSSPRVAVAQPAKPGVPQPTASSAVSAIKAGITGKIEIDPTLRSQVADTDTVFIFVRAAQGSHMPLVALRKQVRDLPVSFSFDDAASLSPDRKLSSEQNVVVGARISKSGDAMPQPSDIQVLSATLTPSAKNVTLRLKRP